jgi:hypothetical protein
MVAENCIWTLIIIIINWKPLYAGVWGSGCIAPSILNLSTGWRPGVSFLPRRLYPRGEKPGAHWIGGCVGPRSDMDVVAKRSCPARNGTTAGRSVFWLTLLSWLTQFSFRRKINCYCQTTFENRQRSVPLQLTTSPFHSLIEAQRISENSVTGWNLLRIIISLFVSV